jgi:hypothetical protein
VCVCVSVLYVYVCVSFHVGVSVRVHEEGGREGWRERECVYVHHIGLCTCIHVVFSMYIACVS